MSELPFLVLLSGLGSLALGLGVEAIRTPLEPTERLAVLGASWGDGQGLDLTHLGEAPVRSCWRPLLEESVLEPWWNLNQMHWDCEELLLREGSVRARRFEFDRHGVVEEMDVKDWHCLPGWER